MTIEIKVGQIWAPTGRDKPREVVWMKGTELAWRHLGEWPLPNRSDRCYDSIAGLTFWIEMSAARLFVPDPDYQFWGPGPKPGSPEWHAQEHEASTAAAQGESIDQALERQIWEEGEKGARDFEQQQAEIDAASGCALGFTATRLPPCNDRAEAALLGSLLTNNAGVKRVCKFLLPERFADPIHGVIYAAIVRRWEAGQVADVVTLAAEFEHTDALTEVGGPAYLARLTSSTPIIDVEAYAVVIVDAWMRRQLMDMTEQVMVRAQRCHLHAFRGPIGGHEITRLLQSHIGAALVEINDFVTTIRHVPEKHSADGLPF